ncbi:MAG: hypothetical protein HY866_13980 [Chloroflexi bacterium]|nr:hypothetical protein [Chloroflexota bacterium]
MNKLSRFPAVVAYLIPVAGWLYVFVFQRKNALAMYHLRQAVGLFVFLAAALAGWAVIAWVLAWIPYMGAVAIGLFTIVIAAYLCGAAIWILGLSHALRMREIPLPIFGRWASRLPIR